MMMMMVMKMMVVVMVSDIAGAPLRLYSPEGAACNYLQTLIEVWGAQTPL
jgi:hypothetical protein